MWSVFNIFQICSDSSKNAEYYSAWLVTGSSLQFLASPTVPTSLAWFLSSRYLHIIFKRILSRVGSWQISFQRILTSIPGDIWRGDRLSRALPLHLCYCILGRTPGGQWSISSKSIITRFSSCQGGRDIRHLWHIQLGLPWSRHTWGPWCPHSCRHYTYQKKINI